MIEAAPAPAGTRPSSPAPTEPAPTPGRPYRRGRYLALLALIAVAGGALRVGYVLVAKRHDPLVGDQIYYSAMGRVLARGDGFRDPFIKDRVVPSADHPPLTAIVAAPAGWLSDDPATVVLLQRLTMCVVGAAGVFAVGLAARQAGPRRHRDAVGLVAAALAAVYPGFWINDGLVMAESLGLLSVALAIWATYRALDEPRTRRFALLGIAIGLAALTRAEALLLAPLLVLPAALTRRVPGRERPTPRQRVGWIAASAAAVVLVVGPWVGANMVRFADATTLSTNDGLTLLGTNCDPAWKGPGKGLWVLQCIGAVDSTGDGVDDWTKTERGLDRLGDLPDWSVVSSKYRTAALRYLREHLGELPSVVMVREGRLWGVYKVGGMVFYNTGEGREDWASWAAAIAWWVVAVPGLAGLLLLRREERPAWPLVVQLGAAALVGAVFYGLWRFRIGADAAMVISAAATVVWLGERFSGRRRKPVST